MDGISPGTMSAQIAIGGTTWSDERDLAVCGGGIPTAGVANIFCDPALPGYAPCGCYVGAWWGVVPPPRCAAHGELTAVPLIPATTTTTTLRLNPASPRLSDDDVERIARRVVELLREAKP